MDTLDGSGNRHPRDMIDRVFCESLYAELPGINVGRDWHVLAYGHKRQVSCHSRLEVVVDYLWR